MHTEVYFYSLVFCLFVGPVQVIGGLIRLSKIKIESEYSKGLNRYFSLVVGYILLCIATTVVHNTLIDVEKISLIFLPILPICLAIYYWKIIYSYDRKNAN